MRSAANAKLTRLRRTVDEKMSQRNRTLGEIFQSERMIAGMTQSAVAAKFGRDQTFISKIENGVQRVTLVEAERLAKIYRKTLGEILGNIPRF